MNHETQAAIMAIDICEQTITLTANSIRNLVAKLPDIDITCRENLGSNNQTFDESNLTEVCRDFLMECPDVFDNMANVQTVKISHCCGHDEVLTEDVDVNINEWNDLSIPIIVAALLRYAFYEIDDIEVDVSYDVNANNIIIRPTEKEAYNMTDTERELTLESFNLIVDRWANIINNDTVGVQIISGGFTTVGELIDALSQLPRNTFLTPFGDQTAVLAYDAANNSAYLDSENFIEEEFEINEDAACNACDPNTGYVIENGYVCRRENGTATLAEAVEAYVNELNSLIKHEIEFDYDKDEDVWYLMDYDNNAGCAENVCDKDTGNMIVAFYGESHENGFDFETIHNILSAITDGSIVC